MITTINKLFDVRYGQKEYHNKERLEGIEGSNILISSKGEDNGLYGFFKIPTKFKAPIITIPSTGTIGHAFIQEKDCSVDDNCLILIPKKIISIEDLFQIVYQIRLIKWKYRYGRQITPDRLGQEKLNIVNSKINYKDFSEKIMPAQTEKQYIKKTKTRLTKICELCDISKKTAPSQNNINLEGNTPYISSSSKDNGVVLFTDEKPNFSGGSLTVAKDGNDGCSFYQPQDFITSLHNYVLTPKHNYPKILLIYVGAIIKIRAYCYNHYYPINKKHIEKIGIPMPIDSKGEYNFEYINNLIKNCYGYTELKRYL